MGSKSTRQASAVSKREVMNRAREDLLNQGRFKRLIIPKQTFYVTDTNGHTKDFVVKFPDKSTPYLMEDVRNVVNSFIYVIKDAIRHGESVFIPGLGTFTMTKISKRVVKLPGRTEYTEVPEHYKAKFRCSNSLHEDVKMYEAFIKGGYESYADMPSPMYDIGDDIYLDCDLEDEDDAACEDVAECNG